ERGACRGAVDRLLPGIRGDRDLRDRDRRPHISPDRSVRESVGMKRPLAVELIGTGAFSLLPCIGPAYYVGLMIPFFGYAIALLGFNLLFGYTGLLSFGHAMFLGVGAFGGGVLS